MEIGRWLGGSTILLCSASYENNTKVISVDLKVKAPHYASDELIESVLRNLGIQNYTFYIHDSATFVPQSPIDLILIDGDHSYEGVKKDFENIYGYLKPGAHILFHDADASRPFATKHEEVYRFMVELKGRSDLEYVSTVGSIVHFIKK